MSAHTNDELLALAAAAGCIDTAKPWAPLSDDGDALRLAIKLGLLIDVNLRCKFVNAMGGPEAKFVDVTTEYADDANAATRRAIVEAAAQIGMQS